MLCRVSLWPARPQPEPGSGDAWFNKEAQMLRRANHEEQTLSRPASERGRANGFTLLTILGPRAKVEGTFEITDVQIDCEVAGELNVEGKLVIGESGVVHADVQTVDAVVRGQYEGNMVATGEVEITATGRVSGNIKTESLVISEGGCFVGSVTEISQSQGRRGASRQTHLSLRSTGQRGGAGTSTKGLVVQNSEPESDDGASGQRDEERVPAVASVDARIAEIRQQADRKETAE